MVASNANGKQPVMVSVNAASAYDQPKLKPKKDVSEDVDGLDIGRSIKRSKMMEAHDLKVPAAIKLVATGITMLTKCPPLQLYATGCNIAVVFMACAACATQQRTL